MTDKLQALYDGLKDSYDLGNIDEFRNKMNDETKRRAFYDAVSPDYDLGDYDSFNQKLGYSNNVEETTEANRQMADSITPVSAPEVSSQFKADDSFLTDEDRESVADTAKMSWREAKKLSQAAQGIAGQRPTADSAQAASLFINTNREAVSQMEETENLNQQRRIEAAQPVAEAFRTLSEDYKEQAKEFRNESQQLEKDYFALTQAARDYATSKVGPQPTKLDSKEGWGKAYMDYLNNNDPDKVYERYNNLGQRNNRNNTVSFLEHMANQTRRRANQTLKQAEKGTVGRTVSGVGYGLSQPGTWSLGMSDLWTAENVISLANKLKDGKELTDYEQAALDAYGTYEQAASILREYDTRGFKAGGTTGEMLPFMIQMALNPAGKAGTTLAQKGVKKAVMNAAKKSSKEAAEAVAEQAMREYGTMATRDLLRNYGVDGAMARIPIAVRKVGGDLAASAVLANTLQVGSTLNNIAERKYGTPVQEGEHYTFDPEQEKSWAEAAYKGELSSIIENFTEMMGEWRVLGLADKMSKFGGNSVGRIVRAMGDTDFAKGLGKVLQDAHWSGTIGEMLEEEYGIILNSLLTGDNKVSDLWDLDQQIDIFLGVGLFGGVMGGAKMAAYPMAYVNSKKKLEEVTNYNQENITDWAKIQDAIDNADNNGLAGIIGSALHDRENRTDNGKAEAILNYIDALQRYRGVTIARDMLPADADAKTMQAFYLQGYDGADKQAVSAAYQHRKSQMELMNPGITDILDKEGIDVTVKDENGNIVPLFEGEYRQMALDYLDAKAAYDGMLDGITNRAQTKARAAEAIVRSNDNNGQQIEATTRAGESVHIISGDVVMDNGAANLDQSSKSIIIRHEDGTKEMVSPLFIKSIDLTTDTETAATMAAQRAAQESVLVESQEAEIPDADTGMQAMADNELGQQRGIEQADYQIGDEVALPDGTVGRVNLGIGQTEDGTVEVIWNTPEGEKVGRYTADQLYNMQHPAQAAPETVRDENVQNTESAAMPTAEQQAYDEWIAKHGDNALNKLNQTRAYAEKELAARQEELNKVQTELDNLPDVEDEAITKKKAELEKKQADLQASIDNYSAVLDKMNAIQSVYDAQNQESATEQKNDAIRNRAAEWEKNTGVKVTILERLEDVPNDIARQKIEAGEDVKGWFENGQVYVYLPNASSTQDFDQTFIHEVIAHKGLKEMLGAKVYAKLCQQVWDQLMTEAQKKEYLSLVKHVKGEEAKQLAAADEFIAYFAEKMTMNPTAEEMTTWEQFVQMLVDLLNKVFGTQVTEQDLSELLIDSLTRYQMQVKAQEAKVKPKKAPKKKVKKVNKPTDFQNMRKAIEDVIDEMDFETQVRYAVSKLGHSIVWDNDPNTRTKGLGSHIIATKGGASEQDRRKYFAWEKARRNGGLYPEEIAERIMADMPESITEGYDTRDVLRIILDAITGSTSPSDVVKQVYQDLIERQEKAEREEAERQQEAYAKEKGFDSYEEYAIFESGEDIVPITDEEQEQLDNILYGEAANGSPVNGVQGVVQPTAGQESADSGSNAVGQGEGSNLPLNGSRAGGSETGRDNVLPGAEGQVEAPYTVQGERTWAHPATLRDAYESGNEADITKAEKAVGDFIKSSDSIVKLDVTAKEFATRKKQAKKGSAEYKMCDFVEKKCKQRIKELKSVEQPIQGLEGYSIQDIQDIILNHIADAFQGEFPEGFQVNNIGIIGSRANGTAREDSVLDVLLEYEGDISEDALFDALQGLEIDGIKVDINPITPGKSGTIQEFLERNKDYKKEESNEETEKARDFIKGAGKAWRDKPLTTLAEVKWFMNWIGYNGGLSKIMTGENGKKFVKFQANGSVTPSIYLGETTPREILKQFLLYDNIMNVSVPSDIQKEFETEQAAAKKTSDALWADDREQIKNILTEAGIPFADVIDSERGSRIVFTDRKNDNGNYLDYMDVSDAEQAKDDIEFIRAASEKYNPAKPLTDEQVEAIAFVEGKTPEQVRKENTEAIQGELFRETPQNTSLDDVLFRIDVNHNSPYLLKKADGAFIDPISGERLGFDTRFMGSGEGNQAHGYGSYFSVKDLREYAGKENPRNTFLNLRYKGQWYKREEAEDLFTAYDLIQSEGTVVKALRKAEKFLDNAQNWGIGDEAVNTWKRVTDLMKNSGMRKADFKAEWRPNPGHHYDVTIPDNNGTNYLEEMQTLRKSQRRRIADAVRNLEGEPAKSVKFVDYKNGWNSLADMIEREQWAYLEIRDRLVQAFGGRRVDEKRVSELMNSIGFDGVHYNGSWDGECYVIFNPEDAQIVDHVMFRQGNVTPEQDNEYMKAVEAGDMEKAQQMVADAFKAAYPNTKVVDENGKPLVVYHGTPYEKFNEFLAMDNDQIWFTENKVYAQAYAGKLDEFIDEEGQNEDLRNHDEWNGIYEIYLNIRNPYSVPVNGDIVAIDTDHKPGGNREFFITEEARPYIDQLTKELDLDEQKIIDAIKHNGTGEMLYDLYDSPYFREALQAKGYDGIKSIEGVEKRNQRFITYGVFQPNQIKSAEPVTRDDNGNVIPLSQRFTESDDIRFRTANDKASLMGAHNLSEDKLRKVLKQGGLANPSMAIVDTNKGIHKGYGNISLIPYSSQLDASKTRGVATYSGDVYSPSYPGVTHKLTGKGEKKIDEMAKRLAKGDKTLEDYLHTRIFNHAEDNGTRLSTAYLLDKGIEPDIVYESGQHTHEEYERVKDLMDRWRKAEETADDKKVVLDILMEQEKDRYEALIEKAGSKDNAVKNFAKKRYEEAKERITDENGELYYSVFDQYLDGVRRSEQLRNERRIDLYRTEDNSLQKITQAGLTDDYWKWVENLFTDEEWPEMLFGGFTPAGYRRWFPNTLENASRLMNKQSDRNADDWNGWNATKSLLLKKMRTLADIRKMKDQLKSQEEYDEEIKKLSDGWTDIVSELSSMQRISDNQFMNMDYAENRLQEAITMSDPIDYLNKEYGYDIDKDSDFAKDLLQAIDNMKKAPAKYFETKFNRPVYLNEFKHAIVPDNIDPEIRSGLTQAGIKVTEYESGNNEDYENKVREATEGDNDVRFREGENTLFSQEEMQGNVNSSRKNGIFASNTQNNERRESDIQREGNQNRPEDTGRRTDAVSAAQPEEIVKPLRKLEEGETCHVERKLSETGDFSFIGKDEIETIEDVAYIFRKLETKNVENSFVAFVKDGKATVLHIGMGTLSSAQIDTTPMTVMMKNIKPDMVYFIHNHPSGQLISSAPDRQMWQVMKRIIGNKLGPGIIIDTTRGEYGMFEGDAGFNSTEKFTKKSEGDEKIPVYRFDERVFSKDYDPKSLQIRTSKDIAAFVAGHRLGERDKISILCVDHGMRILGNFFLPYTDIASNDTIKKIAVDSAYYAGMSGATGVILYGNGVEPGGNNLPALAVRELKGFLTANNLYLVDIIGCYRDDTGYYYSYADHGYISEPKPEYGAAESVRENTLERAATAETVDSDASLKEVGKLLDESKKGTPEYETYNSIYTQAASGKSVREAKQAIINEFENASETPVERSMEQEAAPFAQPVADLAGVRFRISTEPSQIRSEYNGGDIVVYNPKNVADVQAAVMRESYTHKDIRNVPNWEDMTDTAYRLSDGEIATKAIRNGMDFDAATEEWMYENAERMVVPFERMMAKNGVNFIYRMTGDEIRMYLTKTNGLLDDADLFIAKEELPTEESLRFRTSSNPTTPRDVYDASQESLANKLYRSYIDYTKPVRDLQELIAKESGSPIEDFENAWEAENQRSSKSKAEIEKFELEHFEKMRDAVRALEEATGMNYKDVLEYLIAKHGLERNEVLAMRDAEAEFKKYQEENPTGTKTVDDFYKKNRKKDYSGLTSLSGEKKVADAEDYAKAVVDAVESAAQDEADALWQAIDETVKAIQKKRYQSGLISKDQMQHEADMFDNYIPLRGFAETIAEDVYDYYEDTQRNRPQRDRKAQGRTSLADDPLATLGAMAASAIMQGNKNLVKQRFLNMVQNHKNEIATVKDVWVVNHGTPTNPVWEPEYPDIHEGMNADDIRNELENYTQRMEQMEALGMAKKAKNKLNIKWRTLGAQAQQHIITVRRNGEEQMIIINGNPQVARTMNGINNPDANLSNFMRGVRSVQRFMAANFTTRNPAFVVSNLCRDLGFALMAVGAKENETYRHQFMKNIMGVVGKTVKMGTLIRKWQNGTLDMNDEVESYFAEFMDNGGETGYTAENTVDAFRKKMEKGLKNQNWAAKSGEALLDFFELCNRSVEDFTRFMTFMTSRQMGRTVQRSVADAKNITVNFNRKGSGEMGQKYIASAYLFLNAGIQSLQNVAKICGINLSMGEKGIKLNINGKKLTEGAAILFGSQIILGFLVPMLNEFMMGIIGGDDDDEPMVDENGVVISTNPYRRLTEWERRNNLCIWLGGNRFAKIPLAIELRAFYGLGETMYGYMAGIPNPNPGADVVGQMLDLLPVNFVENGGMVPDAIAPIWESFISNKNYQGIPLYNDSDFLENNPEASKAYSGTGPMYMAISRWVNELGGGDDVHKSKLDTRLTNPAIMQHIVEGYLGGLLTTTRQTAKLIGQPIEKFILGKDVESIPARDWPVVNRLYINTDKRNDDRYVKDRYYFYRDKAEQMRHDVREYEKRLDDPRYVEKYQDLITSPDYLEYITFDALNKAVKDAHQDVKEFGDEFKVFEVDAMRELVNALDEDSEGFISPEQWGKDLKNIGE